MQLSRQKELVGENFALRRQRFRLSLPRTKRTIFQERKHGLCTNDEISWRKATVTSDKDRGVARISGQFSRVTFYFTQRDESWVIFYSFLPKVTSSQYGRASRPPSPLARCQTAGGARGDPRVARSGAHEFRKGKVGLRST